MRPCDVVIKDFATELKLVLELWRAEKKNKDSTPK